jgi:hypothetical protein
MKKPTRTKASLTPAAKPVRQRTAAQAEAARRNGAKSRGPKTAAGKAVSSTNATYHGILSRRIMPLANDGLEHREYLHLRNELGREFTPQTMTEHNAVDVLAFDYVRLGRVAQMQEPPPDNEGNGSRQFVCDAEESVQIVKQVKLAVENSVAITVFPEMIEGLLRTVQTMKDDSDPATDPLADWKSAEKSKSMEILEQLKLQELDVENRDTLSKVISSKLKLNAKQKEWWALLMDCWRAMAEQDVADAKAAQYEYRRTHRPASEGPTRAAELERLQRYEAQIRRAIVRGIEFLETRRRVRR